MTEFAAGFGGRTGLQISATAGSAPRALSSATELALFRVAQEALMNVYNHSGAQSANVRLSFKNRSAILEVEDDGTGIEAPSAVTPGVGISGMQARMMQLGGSLTLGSRGKGLLVQAVAPAPRRPSRSLLHGGRGRASAGPVPELVQSVGGGPAPGREKPGEVSAIGHPVAQS